MSSWTPFSQENSVFRATAAGPPEPLGSIWPTGTSQKRTQREGLRPRQSYFPNAHLLLSSPSNGFVQCLSAAQMVGWQPPGRPPPGRMSIN